jgi:hypothetical protein
MENHEYGDIVGSRDAPFVNRLATRGALATHSYAVTHPSLPNYLALTGGATFGIADDCTDCHVAQRNIIDQLEARGLSWRAYMEGMPSPCFRGAGSGGYAKKHDPFAYYDDIAGAAGRCAEIVPADRLSDDLRSGRLPAFVWLTPDLCHDMHDCSVRTGDRYLARVVPSLERALGPHGFLALVWDEGTSDAGCCRLARGGRVPLILVGPDVKRGLRAAAPYDHYSLLRTIDDAIGAAPLGAAGCGCTTPLDALFETHPRNVERQTG